MAGTSQHASRTTSSSPRKRTPSPPRDGQAALERDFMKANWEQFERFRRERLAQESDAAHDREQGSARQSRHRGSRVDRSYTQRSRSPSLRRHSHAQHRRHSKSRSPPAKRRLSYQDRRTPSSRARRSRSRTPGGSRESRSPIPTAAHRDMATGKPQGVDPAIKKLADAVLGSEHGGRNPSPFVPAIRDYPYPRKFKIPEGIPEYHGTTDPRDFLNPYVHHMEVQHATDEILCKAFCTSLRGKARQWFDDLPRGSIASFRDLVESFLSRFFQLKKFTKSTADLMNIRQGKDELLADFLARFNEESLQVENRTDELVIAAFMNGLNPGAFYLKLAQDTPKTVSKLMSLVEAFSRAEEANKKKRDTDKSSRKPDDKEKGKGSDSRGKPGVFDRLNFNKGRIEPRVSGQNLTPLTKSRTEILSIHRDVLRAPPPLTSPANKRNRDLFCAYHNDHGHETEACNDLKKEIEDCLKNGMLRQYIIQGAQQRSQRWAPRQAGRGGSNQGNRGGRPYNHHSSQNTPAYAQPTQPQHLALTAPPAVDNRNVNGVINTIFGGISAATSQKALKAQARRIPPQEPVHKRLKQSETIIFSEEDEVPPLSPHTDALVIKAIVANKEIRRVHIDQGSAVDVMYVECFRKTGLSFDAIQPTSVPLTGFATEVVRPLGTISLAVTVGDYPKDKTLMSIFYIIDAPSPFNIILGRPWINGAKAVPSTYHLCVKFPTDHGVATVRGCQNVARECMRIALQNTVPEKRVNSVIRPAPTHPRVTPRGKVVGSTVEVSDEVESVVLDLDFPERVVQIGASLPEQVKQKVVELLRQYRTVFAWSSEDMPGVSPDLMVHRLNIDPRVKPVRQKRRTFAPERSQAISEEVSKLVKTDILKEVVYPTWLANPVMVKKPDGSWRMCIDYTDLNKHCPKDCYPLPVIDQKVEALGGFEVFMFLDAYKGYHQILMADEDAEKTAFVTDIGIFCYKKMPFGLKNAGATYQRMMDRVFAKQIGRNLEVYVDDMVIKCRKVRDVPQELEETLKTLLSVNLRLNPKKCVFGVGTGKFLGYMVSRRGVEANPSKINALLQMPQPRTIRDVQRLTGCLAALSRFLSRSADRSFEFFRLLRNMKTFAWTEECQNAFQELKAHLVSLPTISIPTPGETLYLYLATSVNAVSAVLVREEDGIQKPVYFVSHALQGPETRYTVLEKLVLALVHAARRLRPYFQAHPICVLTGCNIRQILHKPEASGRLMKWAVELGEHDIEYRPRGAIKGQALADFLVEMQENAIDGESDPKTDADDRSPAAPPRDEWLLHVDGASNDEGSGAGILLVSPDGIELAYALRFGFSATNNEAEYEAVIGGLQLARRMGAQKVKVHSDSQVVIHQIKGSYEVREATLNRYLERVRHLQQHFEGVDFLHIPRSQNKLADALSKLASSAFSRLNKKVLVEVLPQRSTEGEQVLVIEEVGPNWMTPILLYLTTGELPANRAEARRLRLQASHYVLLEGVLYRRAYLQPLQRCVGPAQARYVMQEMHLGSCASHVGARALMKKIMRWGYFWPTLANDVYEFVQRCENCQRHASITRQPQAELISIQSPWPFVQWGIDILGPLPEAPGRVKFLLVAIDYFTKWIEVEPLATITGKNILRFVWRNIVCRFGIPHVIISDNGKQFAEEPFKSWCAELNIQQKFTAVAHPQANGQVEVTNRTILQGLKTRLGKSKGNWVEELPNVLWAYRTTPRVSTGETPYSLVYGTEAVIPAEIGLPSPRVVGFVEATNEEELRCNLDLLQEKREQSYIKQAKYKESMAKYYHERVLSRQFRPGDLVLRKNEASHAEAGGKLSANWEGPYVVSDTTRSGSYMLTTVEGKMLPRPWHISNLRRFYV